MSEILPNEKWYKVSKIWKIQKVSQTENEIRTHVKPMTLSNQLAYRLTS